MEIARVWVGIGWLRYCTLTGCIVKFCQVPFDGDHGGVVEAAHCTATTTTTHRIVLEALCWGIRMARCMEDLGRKSLIASIAMANNASERAAEQSRPASHG
jgi:hypothetical protein